MAAAQSQSCSDKMCLPLQGRISSTLRPTRVSICILSFSIAECNVPLAEILLVAGFPDSSNPPQQQYRRQFSKALDFA